MLLLRKKYNLIFHCIAFITAFATGSCKKTDVNDAASVFLDESVLSEAIPLQMEDAWYPADSIYSVRFYVYADTVLIIENNRLAGNYLDFYNIPTKRLIAQKLFYGEGPGEWLFAQIHNEGRTIHAIDYVNARFCNLDVQKVTDSPETMPELIPYPRNIITSPPVAFGDSVVCINPFHYVSHRMGIDQQPPRFYAVEKGCRQHDIPMDFEYMTVNVGQGITGADSKRDRIFFASNDASVIEFYDSHLNLWKTVSGPLNLPEADLAVTPWEDGKREVSYKRDQLPSTYTQYTAFNDTLYFVYTGVYGTVDDAENTSPYILCFDWDGNFLKCYHSPVPISSVSVSHKDPGTFYATVKDEEGNPKLVKLTPAASHKEQ